MASHMTGHSDLNLSLLIINLRVLSRWLALALVGGLPFSFQIVESILRVGCAYKLICTGAISVTTVGR
ncbi:hypothetical protein EV424DRAFT_1074726 [Suillus variegatus]|nr:hypothetical protein EV424DRAFT_1074726 [Suillus variegatus]